MHEIKWTPVYPYLYYGNIGLINIIVKFSCSSIGLLQLYKLLAAHN